MVIDKLLHISIKFKVVFLQKLFLAIIYSQSI